MPGDDEERLPRITAGLLRNADTMCPRRLDHEHRGARGNRRSDGRFRVANLLVEDARLGHVDLRAPEAAHFRPTDDLVAEQQRVYELAASWYVQLFADRPVRSVDLPFETEVPRLGVRLVGPVGLAVEDATGHPELRVLRLGQGPIPTDPLGSAEIRFALLRIAPWANGAPVTVVVADLIRGEVVSHEIDGAHEVAELDAWLDDRVARIRDRVATPRPRSGTECGWCPFIAGCDAHATSAGGVR